MAKKIKPIVIDAIILIICIGAYYLMRFLSLKMELSIASWIWKVDAILIMTFAVLLVVSIIKLVLNALHPAEHRSATLITIVDSLIHYVAAIVILCWGLSILGVSVTAIVTSVGIIALIVGFGAESLIADVVTGFFMLFENQYNVGDIIEIDGFRGKVVSIGIRTTSIADTGNNIRIINNSEMKNLINKSDQSSAAICDFPVPYETDIEKLEEQIPEILKKIHEGHADIMAVEPIYLGVQELASSAIVLRFKAEVKEQDIYNAMRIMNHDFLILFREIGIECPFMQVTVRDSAR